MKQYFCYPPQQKQMKKHLIYSLFVGIGMIHIASTIWLFNNLLVKYNQTFAKTDIEGF